MTTIALFSWPVVVFILFLRLNVQSALIWSVLGGYLLLPNRTIYNLPLLPGFDKDFAPAISAVLAAVIIGRYQSGSLTPTPGQHVVLKGWIPGENWARALLVLLIAGTAMTTLTNGAPQVFGDRVLRALRPYDAFSDISGALSMMLPLFLGRKFLAHPDAHKDLLRIFCIAALAYSLLALLEVRLSPQLHRWVYGFHPHGWVQNLRGGGFRPTVFLLHGLFVGLFFACMILAAVGYARAVDKRYIWVAAWLLLTLVLVKSLGALLIAVVLLPVALFARSRIQMLVACVVIIGFLAFPALRSSNFFSTEQLTSLAAMVDERRAGSLQFRFENEDILLERANQKPIFGWGGWARNRVFDEFGRDISITDGEWIIRFGISGWVGYISLFGLLSLSVLFLTFRKRKYEVTLATSTLSLILAGNLVDLIPNSGLTPITWLIAGALMGRLELSREALTQNDANPQAPQGGPLPYARARPNRSRDPAPPDLPAYQRRDMGGAG